MVSILHNPLVKSALVAAGSAALPALAAAVSNPGSGVLHVLETHPAYSFAWIAAGYTLHNLYGAWQLRYPAPPSSDAIATLAAPMGAALIAPVVAKIEGPVVVK